MKLTPALLAIAALAACSTSPAPTGQILSYTRSNSDGSEPERVSVYRKSASEVEVYKMVSRCTNSALVTARFDPASDDAIALTGGRLTREGTQQPFAWLDRAPGTRDLTVRLGAPDAAPVQVVTLPGFSPWRLYDFDFADFNALARPPVRGETRAWSMALAWPDGAPEETLRVMGEMTATWQARERRAGVDAHRYALSGAGFDGGFLWLDARDGTVVEVTAPVPNHPGYADFRLVLTSRAQGPAAWSELLASHWSDCAPE